jgi:hypothetical protein
MALRDAHHFALVAWEKVAYALPEYEAYLAAEKAWQDARIASFANLQKQMRADAIARMNKQ